jgi:hypothetical protein
MSRVTNRNLRVLAGPRLSPVNGPISRKDFYREEFLKHQQCLRAQREFFSAHAIERVDAALTETIKKLDHICQRCDCDHVVSCLLRQFDSVTGLSSLSDSKTYH